MYKIFAQHFEMDSDQKISAKNKRLKARFSARDKNLRVAMDQNIVQLLDLSDTGFKAKVSQQMIHHYQVEEIYSFKLFSNQKDYSCRAKLVWKNEDMICGFKIEEIESLALGTIQKLLYPDRVIASMSLISENEVEPQLLKAWYHSEDGVDLFVWKETSGTLRSWTLQLDKLFVTHDQNGYTTGSIVEGSFDVTKEQLENDRMNDEKLIQFSKEIVAKFL